MSKKDIAEINQLNRQWVAALNAGDADAWQDTFASNFVWMPPDVPKLVGKKAVVAYGKAAFLDSFKFKLSQKLGQLQILGATAVSVSSFKVVLTPKAGGDPIKRSGNFMWLFQKQKNRAWKITKAIWNFDGPPA